MCKIHSSITCGYRLYFTTRHHHVHYLTVLEFDQGAVNSVMMVWFWCRFIQVRPRDELSAQAARVR